MSALLTIKAGPAALKHLRENGLAADDVQAVFGASGAAKWLSIYGLDQAIFEHWVRKRSRPLHLVGTSIGAWKLAAAATEQPAEAMANLARAYIEQRYGPDTTREDVAAEARRMLDAYLDDTQVDTILSQPSLHLHIGTVRSKGLMGYDQKSLLALAMAQAMIWNIAGRNALKGLVERVVFTQRPTPFLDFAGDAYGNTQVQLDRQNFRAALIASGSIPYVLPAVNAIPHAPDGLYRDGGLLDYHPVPSNFSSFDGLILYPHFYSELVPGWFDKPYAARRARGAAVDKVVLLAPSETFVKSLPYGRISDRKDFKRFAGKDEEREQVWLKCMNESQALGEEFLSCVKDGSIASRAEPL